MPEGAVLFRNNQLFDFSSPALGAVFFLKKSLFDLSSPALLMPHPQFDKELESEYNKDNITDTVFAIVEREYKNYKDETAK